MKYLRNALYLGFMLLMLLAACGPATPTPGGNGPINNKPNPFPNVIVSVVPPVLVPACTPPDVKVSATSYCANQVKGLGGAKLVDSTMNPVIAFWVDVNNNMQCTPNADFTQNICIGTQGAQRQYIDCTVCGAATSAKSYGDYKCANGTILDKYGWCDIDPNGDWSVCAPGSHYSNQAQNCVDNMTGKSAVSEMCPPGYPYLLADGYCLAHPYPAEVFNCQYTTVQLGSCVALNKVPNVVAFCQNNAANIGGANITVPAGSNLTVDVRGNHLDSCTPGTTQPDGTQLFTCLGTSGMTFNAQLCTDPASCTTYKESLGTCNGKSNPGSGPCVMDSTGACK